MFGEILLPGRRVRAFRGSPAFFKSTLAVALVAAATAARTATADEEPAARARNATVRLDFEVLDTSGARHSLRTDPERAAIVFVFLGTECPIANSYLPELNRQFESLRGAAKRVDFFGVISDRAVTRAAAAKHAAEFKIGFPVLFDASGELAAALGPTHTPEAFVIDRAGKVAYRGRIDDMYADLDKKRTAASTHDLADAIAAVLAGSPVAVARSEPIGCLVEAAVSGKKAGPTYNRDIAPILQANCMNCHREGEIAPFPLMNYADASRRARQIVRVTQSRFMPPWRPEPDFGHFLGEQRLTERELALIRDWAESGAPEGPPEDLPPAPKFAEGWLLGEPDLVVEMEEPFEVPADGPDVFRNFVIPTDLEADKLVTVAEFRPGNRRVVHHSIFYLDNSGTARRKDAAAPGPGYATFGGPGFIPVGSIGGWAPGGAPQALRDGMGRQLPKGCDIVLQIHYHPTGKVEVDRSSIGLHFVKQPSRKVVVPLTIADRGLYIPAGAERHPMSGSYTVPMDLTLVGITPHMHLLGREMKVIAKPPEEDATPLIWIKDWSFNWQEQYIFAEPIRLKKGTRLQVAAAYDNSEKNPLNPNTPPKDVTWGEQTTDEMFICFFLATTDDPDQLLYLVIDNARALQPHMKRARRPAGG